MAHLVQSNVHVDIRMLFELVLADSNCFIAADTLCELLGRYSPYTQRLKVKITVMSAEIQKDKQRANGLAYFQRGFLETSIAIRSTVRDRHDQSAGLRFCRASECAVAQQHCSGPKMQAADQRLEVGPMGPRCQ